VLIKAILPVLLLSLGACTHAIEGRAERVSGAIELRTQNSFALRDETVYAHYDALQTDAARQSYRNRIVASRIRVIDAYYEEYEQALYSEGIGTSVGAGASAFALTTMSAALSNTETQSILSTLAALITGSQAVFEKEALFDRTLPALIDSMNARRQRQRASIIENMRRPLSEWSIEDALLAVDDYESAGDINTAIGNVAAQASSEREAAEEAVAAATYPFATSESARRLEAYLYPNDQRDADRYRDFQNWVRQHGDGRRPSEVLRGGGEALDALREQYLAQKQQ
jgi:hypothetical protein